MRRGLALVVVATAVHLAGCAAGAPAAPAGGGTPSVAPLAAYGPLFTVMVDVAGTPRRFLVDTGGGMTVFTPQVAAGSGCAPGGPLTGFRMTGERLDAPRCEGATVGMAGWASPPHTVLVMDINKLLPPDWPRLDGLLSLSTFHGHVVSLDLARQRLIVDDQVPEDARRVRARFEPSMSGLALVAFVASRHARGDVWLEVDSGSTSALIVNDALAPVLGLTAPLAAPGVDVDLFIDAGQPVRTPAETAPMIFDGNIGLGTMRSWVLTFDLAKEQVWIRTPVPSN